MGPFAFEWGKLLTSFEGKLANGQNIDYSENKWPMGLPLTIIFKHVYWYMLQ